ncbi:hypothetical protein ABFV99_13900 [Cytobacillus horneckiae]|uniref:hypothetical protein n=1 Tax=Cytobacillus horneckiae TaxID=549687 RepID=UPI0034CDBB76
MEEESKPPIQIRIIQNFKGIDEAEFWPSEITTIRDLLSGPLSFKELENLMNRNNDATINDIENKMKIHKKQYDGYIGDLVSMQNVFSYDVDYI